MNYRQITAVIMANLSQAERNMDGLHERGKEKEIDLLTMHLRTVKVLAAGLADDSYEAVKKYLGGNETR